MRTRVWKLAMVAVLLGGLVPSSSAGGYGYGFGYHGYSHYGYGNHRRGYYGGHAYGSGDVAVGLFVGALLGYAIASSYEPYAHRHPYREYRHYGPRYRYYERPPRVVYAEPDRAVTRSRKCLQEREYQTTITIDGQQVQAWGIACLQPDGSWKRPGLNILPPG